jgi:hypothetical protein
MEKAAKDKFLTGIAKKYDKAERAERSTLLDQIVSKLGVHRKSAIRVLRSYLSPKAKKATKKSTKPGKKAAKKATKKTAKKSRK